MTIEMNIKISRLRRRALAFAASAYLAGLARAEMPDCPVEPFSEVSAAQRAQMLAGNCRDESSRWKVAAPRPKAQEASPTVVKAEYSALSSQRFASLLGSLKFDWSGQRQTDGRGVALNTQRAALAAGGLLRVDDDLALQMNLGMEHASVARMRATMSSMWQPTRASMLFAEWAGSEAGTESRRVGGRWWVVPRRVVVELAARQLPNGVGWVDQRIGLAFNLKL